MILYHSLSKNLQIFVSFLIFLCAHVCMHVCAHMYVCVCMYASMCVNLYVDINRSEVDVRCYLLFSTYIRDSFPHWTWRLPIVWAGCQEALLPLTSVPLVLVLQMCASTTGFYMAVVACAVNILLAKTTQAPVFLQFI